MSPIEIARLRVFSVPVNTVRKRFAVDGWFLFDRTVIDRPEDAHVKDVELGASPAAFRVRLIVLHDDMVYCPDRDILVSPEPLETPQCRAVIIGGAGVSQLT